MINLEMLMDFQYKLDVFIKLWLMLRKNYQMLIKLFMKLMSY